MITVINKLDVTESVNETSALQTIITTQTSSIDKLREELSKDITALAIATNKDRENVGSFIKAQTEVTRDTATFFHQVNANFERIASELTRIDVDCDANKTASTVLLGLFETFTDTQTKINTKNKKTINNLSWIVLLLLCMVVYLAVSAYF